MNEPGPAIEHLTRRLAETPGDFLENPLPAKGSVAINVAAVVSDLLRDLGGDPLTAAHAKGILKNETARQLTTMMIACWLLHDQWFRDAGTFAPAAQKLMLSGKLAPLANLVEPNLFVTDPDRREELARFCLEALGLRPKGESVSMANDRLTTLNSVERDRVIRETKKAQQRMRKIQEEMRRKKAAEAAPAWGRE